MSWQVTPMSDDRFMAWAAVGVDPSRAVQIVREWDGRVFAMSVDEARMLATRIEKAADQAQSRRVKRW